MDSIGVDHFSGADESGDIEITLSGGCRADTDRLVGQSHMFQVAVSRRVDSNGTDVQFAAGSQYTQGDFAPVCNDDLVKHGGALFDDEEGLTEFDRLTVFSKNGLDNPRLVGLDLIHDLHGLDDTERIADADRLTDLDKGLGSR